MFIIFRLRAKFKELKITKFILFLALSLAGSLKAQQIIRGIIVDNDSITPMPFVYLINKSNGNGTMSDNDGKFTLSTNSNDTLVCSYVGYVKLFFPVKYLKPDRDGRVKLVMMPLAINLAPVTVTTFRYKEYERDYMNDIIDRSRIKNVSYVSSPFSALYMRFSKEGKQIQKLAKIFEEIKTEEEVQRKLSREILVRLTGDKDIDYFAFRRYCYYVSDYYITTHEGAELYSRVMDCYKSWKAERGGYRPRETKEENTKPDPDARWKKREEPKKEN